MDHAPCYKQRVFINPQQSQPAEIRKAIDVCRECPIKKQCAEHAITAGSPPGYQTPTPPDDVIQAGVWCTGDYRTLVELHKVAGLPTPQKRRIRQAGHPTHCLECGHRMQTRKYGQPTQPDVLTHSAHGLCRKCDTRNRKQDRVKLTEPRLHKILKEIQ